MNKIQDLIIKGTSNVDIRRLSCQIPVDIFIEKCFPKEPAEIDSHAKFDNITRKK